MGKGIHEIAKEKNKTKLTYKTMPIPMMYQKLISYNIQNAKCEEEYTNIDIGKLAQINSRSCPKTTTGIS
ncbi:hypothetical protein JCM15457_1640 [Liquorilactobacillus sucicola DSM 21376 = JCM 15457]|nr:hypothetical protein JCM15457_1640 [Liquorilactobacillus sucicola DSM 21376 = JCM 15457]